MEISHDTINKKIIQALPSVPIVLHRELIDFFPKSKVQIRIDEGLTDDELMNYIRSTFNVYFIDNGSFPDYLRVK